MTTIVDPRERLVQAGSKVLDATYEEEQFNVKYADVLKVLRDKSLDGTDRAGRALDGLPKAEQTAFLLGMLTLGTKRESAVREYVTIRETIEGMSAVREAVPDVDA